MEEAKLVNTPITQHFKLLDANSPKENDVEHKKMMATVPNSQAMRSLMYLMISTRPDVAYVASLVSRYMGDWGKRHWETIKWIIRYLKGTQETRLLYQ